MLSKQKEAFDGFVNELDRKEKKQMPLVEKFFHSIFPVEKRSLANPKEISFLFRMFLKMSNSKFEKKAIDTLGGAFYAFLSFEALEKAEAFLDKVSKCRPARRDVIKIQLHVYDKTYIGLIVSNAADEENVEILSLVSSLSL